MKGATLATKAFAALRRLIDERFERLDERLKAASCVLDPESRLHPSSRIVNLQSNRLAVRIGRGSQVRGELLVFAHGGSIAIGEHTFVGEGSRLWSGNSISIGNGVMISHSVNIHDCDSHSYSAAHRRAHFMQLISSGHPKILEDVASAPIAIEDDVWIGFNSTILKGVRIGAGSIIGAASVVIHDVRPYSIMAGNPAQYLGESKP